MRNFAASAVLSVIRAIRVAASYFPALPIVVVYGFPDSEENSLVAATRLASQGRHQVYVICEDPSSTARSLDLVDTQLIAVGKVRLVQKSSLAAIWLTVFARLLLFTHGLFGNPASGSHRLFVNLWHGHGPKKAFSRRGEVEIPSDLIFGNTTAYAGQTAKSLGLPSSALKIIGNVRQDLMMAPPTDEALASLGLSNDRPYVIWMPTFRKVRDGLSQSWADAQALSDEKEVREKLRALLAVVESSAIDFRVKIHPIDADRLDDFVPYQVSNASLSRAGTTLYSFIGGAAGMISDYSGVWVEYLTMDRPLLLFCPDASDYSTGRGFKTPNMMTLAEQLITDDADEVEQFFKLVGSGRDWHGEARRAIAATLDPKPPGRIQNDMVAEIRIAARQKGLDVGL